MPMPNLSKLPNDSRKITSEQIDLFLSVFRGRGDVVAEMWESKKTGKRGYQPICFNEWKENLCRKPCYSCDNPKYRQLDEPLLRRHLSGLTTLGVYPLLQDNTCWLTVGDFDNHDGARDPLDDIQAFHEACDMNDIPCYIFKSKSGTGYHAYWFFSAPVPAWKARAVYHAVLQEAGIIDEDHKLDNSFDRIFPNQDRLTGKGFGNLIAYPFLNIQNNPCGPTRMLTHESGFTEHYADNWGALATIERIQESTLDGLIEEWGLKKTRAPGKNKKSRSTATGKDPEEDGGFEMRALIERAISGNIKKGERDESIFKIACRLRGKNLSRSEAEFFCCSLADQCEQSSSDQYTHADALAKVESAWRYEPNESEVDDGDKVADKNEYLPTICPQKYQLPTVMGQAWEALTAKNDPPVLFKNAIGVIDIKYDDDVRESRPRPRMLDTAGIRLYLSRAANWEKIVRKATFPDIPPKYLCESMLVDPDIPLPYLSRILTAPYFDQDGTLHKASGYSPASKCLLINDIDIGDIPPAPGPADVAWAKAVIDDILCDFPFSGEPEKAHAIALLILPYVRQMIDGSTPIHLVEAPTPRTGKGLLVSSLLLPFLGQMPATTSETTRPEELRKNLTTQLMHNPSYIFFDNINHRVANGVLAEALTSRWWKDRILGGNKEINVRIDCAWIMSANNPSSTSELTGRMARIRLDSKMVRPGSRSASTFKHPDILAHVKSERVSIVKAAITLIQNWIAQKRPIPESGTPFLGGFEEWRNVIGGILMVNGIPGFLENLDELYRENDFESDIQNSFIGRWWDRFNEQSVGVKDLWDINNAMDNPPVFDGNNERADKIKMGIYLKKLDQQVCEIAELGGDIVTVQVVKRGVHNRAQQWGLKLKGMILIPKNEAV